MIVSVDQGSAVPPYEQIRAQIARLVAEGRLPPGSRLPTVRQLALDLGLAVNTVARAYRELESAGLVVSRRRHGTFVTDGAGSAATEAARPAAMTFARAARALGLQPSEATRLLERVWPDAGPVAGTVDAAVDAAAGSATD